MSIAFNSFRVSWVFVCIYPLYILVIVPYYDKKAIAEDHFRLLQKRELNPIKWLIFIPSYFIKRLPFTL